MIAGRKNVTPSGQLSRLILALAFQQSEPAKHQPHYSQNRYNPLGHID